MAINTKSEVLDNLYTTTYQSMKDGFADQIFDATPFYYFMRRNNGLRPLEGSRFISEPLQYAKNDTVTWLTKGGTVSLNDNEILTDATFDWKYVAVSIVRFWQDDQQNRSKHQIMSLIETKLNNAKNALVDEFETDIAAAAASGNEFDGLQLLVKDDPTTSTSIGGINQSTYTWWANKTKNLTGSSFAANGKAEMRTIMNNVSNNLGSDRPNIILCGQTPFEYYEDYLFEFRQFINRDVADASFDTLQFKGTPMIWSPAIGTRMYFLNTNYLWFYYDPMDFMEMTPWKQIPEQPRDRAAQITAVMSLVTNRRRAQGVIYNIDTP